MSICSSYIVGKHVNSLIALLVSKESNWWKTQKYWFLFPDLSLTFEILELKTSTLPKLSIVFHLRLFKHQCNSLFNSHVLFFGSSYIYTSVVYVCLSRESVKRILRIALVEGRERKWLCLFIHYSNLFSNYWEVTTHLTTPESRLSLIVCLKLKNNSSVFSIETFAPKTITTKIPSPSTTPLRH